MISIKFERSSDQPSHTQRTSTTLITVTILLIMVTPSKTFLGFRFYPHNSDNFIDNGRLVALSNTFLGFNFFDPSGVRNACCP